MTPNKARYTTACQQLLALALVLAALTPAASIISLDVVAEAPQAARHPAVALTAYTAEAARDSLVPTAPVDPTVREVQLTAPTTAGRSIAGKRLPQTTPQARLVPGAEKGSTQITSVPEKVTGYGAIGVTWEHGQAIPDTQLGFSARTLTDGQWSDWITVPYHDDHGPDPDSAEGRHARPGTDPLLIGKVDEVQLRATTDGAVPVDMKLAVIDPGQAPAETEQRAAIDTSTMDGGDGADSAFLAGQGSAAAGTQGSGLSLAAARFTPKPVIYSRAQWGADESLRDKSSLHYYEVHAGFVHHTVNANNYTRAEVPGIIRSIYAYHVKSRGWSDIGYNFLVDRFGRIWEGRYGGVDRPVVGAHTLNYNDYSFAMSAIGNYDIAKPSEAMVQAYGTLFAWKLSLHGVDAASTRQWVGSRYFQAINGHRDAAATACPGRYLYARIPDIRKLAAAAQRGWSGRNLESNLASTPYPDLIVRRKSDGRGFIIPTGGLLRLDRPQKVGGTWSTSTPVLASPDLTGDGRADAVVRAADGTVTIRAGDGAGGFGAAGAVLTAFRGRDLLTAVGDITGDGRNDLVARNPVNGRLNVFAGDAKGHFTRSRLSATYADYTSIAGPGDLTGDRIGDLLLEKSDGTMWLRVGNGHGSFHAPTEVPGRWSTYDTVTGYGDWNGDGHNDLLVRDRSTGDGFVLPGDGDGTFGHRLGPLSRTAGMTGLTAAQLVGTSASDLLGFYRGALMVVPNHGTTDLGAPIDTGASFANANLLLNAGDWDRDGKADVIYRSKVNGALYLRRGDGTGHFAKATLLAKNWQGVRLAAAVGDMTGDGWPDLMGAPSGGAMRIYPGQGLQGLKPSYVAYGSITADHQIAVGRWDGDGAPDSLFRRGSTLTLYPGNGPGGLTTPRKVATDLTPYDRVVGVSDLTLGGHADLLVRQKATGDLYLLPGTTSGTGPRRYLGSGMGSYNLFG